ncbi:hypothetical protein [Streptomyces violaceusniger]|uniref:Uncharacterized protein n=1 Tax=Streptomyces violaceusniger (strain Tu 4113) TaxID=653045 RepID=G2PI05_STRV4|nr:hypothetical protein [Streptomyces violaceusniger]AEM88956.1 hypothetical protein Strvi_0183 [Streptomyces violaceusniger Tu 4113]
MNSRKLTVGCRVRYVSHGTPPRQDGSQAFEPAMRAAVVTEVGSADVVGLMVMNPAGLFFHSLALGGVPYDGTGRLPGTWHWPETDEESSVFTVPEAGSGDEGAAP